MFKCRKFPVKLKYRIIKKLVSLFVLYQNTYQLKSERLYIFFSKPYKYREKCICKL